MLKGYDTPKAYIATQGPLEKTLVDFWKMIWQKNVRLVAMLANIIENGKVKILIHCSKFLHFLTMGNIVYTKLQKSNAPTKIQTLASFFIDNKNDFTC